MSKTISNTFGSCVRVLPKNTSSRQAVPLLCWLLLGALAVPPRAEYAPNIRPSADIDAFVYRLAARYGLSLPRGVFDQPMNGAELRRFLAFGDSLRRTDALSEQEAYKLERVREIVTGSRAVYGWKHDERDISGRIHVAFSGFADPSYAFDSARDSVFARGSFAAAFGGNIRLATFYAGVKVSTDYRSEPFGGSSYQPYDGVPYNLYGREEQNNWRSTDMPRGGVVVAGKHVTLETAIDHLKQGPSVYTPLALSGHTPPITYLRTRLDLRRFTYTHAAGLLRSQKDNPKYIYVHRLNIPIDRWRLTLGVGEIVVTGSATDQVMDPDRPVYNGPAEREWEWVYLVPFVPFSFAEQYLGDRDNAALTFDLNLLWPRSFRWYAELFIDDITAPWTVFSDDWGNKWALTVGGQYFGSIRGRDLTVTAEYARIEPWVYTHFYGGSHRFTHFGEPLGASSGPDSDVLRLRCDYALSPRHSIGLSFTNERKGRARGSDINDVFQQNARIDDDSVYVPLYPDSWTKTFLGGDISRSTRLGVHYTLMPLGRVRLWVGGELDMANGGKILGNIRLAFVF